ncbi:PC4/YdbC family ssDNA-binding protein [Clostridium sp.]|uniref:YdbC family protein n=1 Tax=Clostridium sp. TaxID=1506 RepID=UPI003216B15D
MADIKFEIKKELGILDESSKGWKKELNLISWNDKEAKYDIREWDAEHKKMGKGVTFTIEELKKLKEILNELDM